MITEGSAAALIAEMIKRDHATKEVVDSMRAMRRSNIKIVLCFRKTMLELGMKDQLAALGLPV
jgi:radical SAM superfamily enzyme